MILTGCIFIACFAAFGIMAERAPVLDDMTDNR